MQLSDGDDWRRRRRSRSSLTRIGRITVRFCRQASCSCHLFDQFFKSQPLLMRVHAGTCFLPDCVMHIAYCVGAGETATIQMHCSPEKSRFQTGFTLGGSVPSRLSALSKLKELNLDYNELSGELAPELGNFTSLKHLSLRHNRLVGSIPPDLGSLSSLESLDLSGNKLSGELPSTMGNLSNLRDLSIMGNPLRGAIPTELGNLTSLESLHLSYSHLSGPIPPELRNLRNLVLLELTHNQLTGSIPAALGNLASLERLEPLRKPSERNDSAGTRSPGQTEKLVS